MKKLRSIVIATLAALGGALGVAAQENADCLACHEDASLTGHRDGREISVRVDPARLARSTHAALACVDCHQALSGTELPHADEVARVDCSPCHDAEATAHARSLHGQAAARGDRLAPTCVECHGDHGILPHDDPASPTSTMGVPLLCGRCHREGSPVARTHVLHESDVLENYSESIHGEGLFQKGLTVTAVCTSCHTAHDILPHTDPRSSIHHDNVTRTCTQCHGRIESVHRKVIEGKLWEERPGVIPSCVDCHSPHRVRKVFYLAGIANSECLACHGKADLATTRDGQRQSLYVDGETYASSAHARTACAQCHTEVRPSRERPCATIVSRVDCSVCHAEQVTQYETSRHGELHAQNDPDAPTCQDCHAKHDTKSKRLPASPTFSRNVPVLCARCHRAGEKAAVRIDAAVPDIVSSYLDSIHGKGLTQSGLVGTAVCTNCHTSHGELPPSDPRSSVNPAHLADTCGACHHGIEDTFKTSIHATGKAEEGHPLPTCEDCHTSHQITRADVPGFRARMMAQCGRCHEAQATTFFDTFHGKASRLGAEGAANCYDCHGTHDILPVTDPASHLSRRNVVATCGQCHPGSHRRFAGYLTHATHHDAKRYPWLFWSFRLMTGLLVGTLTFALAHTLAWLVRLWRTRAEWRSHKALARTNGATKLYRRFTRTQRTLHILMMLSFFTLAITGMSLKFSYAAWAQLVSRIFGGSEALGVLHRTGAFVLLGIILAHLRDVVFRKRQSGQTWVRWLSGSSSILFVWRDVRQIGQSIRWFFGRGPRPEYGRYTYWEKFDYFAVFWGVLVIGSTGLVLWFPELFTYVLPGWSINVATIIHSDEALLAVGFIFTVHFFNTHFRPDKFPMDPVIFTGRMTVEELRYDKPAEYAERVRAGDLERDLVEPFPRQVERGMRAFGFTALAIGLLLIGLIVYAVLFSYR